MIDKVEGYLEVGRNDDNEIVINHPGLKPDAHGVGHIVFSINQARNLGRLLLKHADDAEDYKRLVLEEERRKAAVNIWQGIPVDHSKQTLTDGSPVTPDHREIDPATGMQKGYVVLSVEERAKGGFVRPVRRSCRHLPCGTVTNDGDGASGNVCEGSAIL
jgi:hypothetical protein